MQDQAFLGPGGGAGRARPAAAASSCTSRRSGCTRTASRSRPASACPRRRCASRSAGVGGAFGAREDVSLQVHIVPAGAAHRPAGEDGVHAARRPSSATSTGTRRASGCATTPPPTARSSRSRRGSCSTAAPTRRRRRRCCVNARRLARRARTRARTPIVDGYAVRTNNPPCGAMRGFGVVQACFAHEAQMDKLAAACGLDPVEIRLRNAMETGDRLITGQVVESVAPVAECIRALRWRCPLPAAAVRGRRPDGAARRCRADGRRRTTCAAASASRVGYQEPDVLRGVRRLLHGPRCRLGRRRRRR